ncbi:hypothetical protein FACS1894216_08180 [Synergistales bacterium]|nr:hypothetical protein FACS1894216_08180 [Synergistales bacterium]
MTENSFELFRYELKVPREAICYMSWTIDAYDGVGFLVTDDPSGMISIFCPNCFKDEMGRILDAFRREGIDIK